MGKVTMQLALVALVLVGLMLASQEADGARIMLAGKEADGAQIMSSAGVISYSGLRRHEGLRKSANIAGDTARSPGQANPHTRGCSKLTGCRG
jgi:hypothetical protein